MLKKSMMISSTLLTRLIVVMISVSFAGCAVISTVNDVADKTLEVVGIKLPEKPEVPDALKAPRTIAIKLHAGDNLNAGTASRPLALIVRLYKLKQSDAFQQATYDAFLSPQKEKEALGADLLEVKEVTLVPGQRYEVLEKVTKEAYYIGVVALFRSPAAHRWKVSFPAAEAAKSGIAIGLHACALTVGTGSVTAGDTDSSNMLAPVRCQ